MRVPSYQGPHEDYRVQKKFTWGCDVCNAEYIYRTQAKECEMYHEIGRRGWVQCPICRKCFSVHLYSEHKPKCIDKMMIFFEKCGQNWEEWQRRNPDTVDLLIVPRRCEEWLEE